MKIINLLKTEPALVAGLVQALLSLLIGAGIHLTVVQSGSILAVVSAASGLIVAIAVREVAAATLTGLLSAVGTLLLTFGVHHVTAGLITEVNALIVAAFALIVRMHLTPKAHLPQRGSTPASGHYPRTT